MAKAKMKRFVIAATFEVEARTAGLAAAIVRLRLMELMEARSKAIKRVVISATLEVK